jgi:hypothetical protein
MKLKMDLGPWITLGIETWNWYFAPSLDCVIQITNEKLILQHPRHVSSRNNDLFCSDGIQIEHLPNTLLKATVEKARRNLLWLTDTGLFVRQDITSVHDSFHELLQDKDRRNPWCYQHVQIPQIYDSLLSDIQDGQVILISNGSYTPHDNYGTAAWMLEGKRSKLHISGRIITPGQVNMQSAYRSELAGILAAITVLNALTSFHNINSSITILCDCEKGLEKAFSNRPLSLQDSCYDLLHAIHYELKNSLIQWTGSHIKGHQDDSTPVELLDRPSQINVMVDLMAKDFYLQAKSLPRHYEVWSNSWYLSVDNIPLRQNIDNAIYDLVHRPSVMKYWERKDRITLNTFDSILWERLGTALNKMTLNHRLFCSKHTSGMCGVGKFQKIWKQQETDACPHCGSHEDSIHVWKCKSPSVTPIWDNSIIQLKFALRNLDTDPDITDAIITYLQAWRNDQFLQPLDKEELQNILDLQDEIGARQFFEGWTHKGWECIQQQYYNRINSRRSGRRWTTALITKLWEIALDLWEFRNKIYHRHCNQALQQDIHALDQKVTELHYKIILSGLLPKDRHLATISLTRLLSFSRIHKKEWLTQGNLALIQAKKRHFLLLRSRNARYRSHQNMMSAN